MKFKEAYRRGNVGTLFLHGATQNHRLERAIERYKAILIKRKSLTRRPSHKRPKGHKRKSGHHEDTEEEADDLFMPKLSDLGDYRFRSELMRMMGTEDIHLGDETWSRRLLEKMLEDYESKEIAHERNLAEEERKRIHELIIEGKMADIADAGPTKDLFSKAFLASGRRKSTKSRRPTYTTTAIFKDEDSNRREREVFTQRQNRMYSAPKSVQIEWGIMQTTDESKESKRKEEREQLLKICPEAASHRGSLDISTGKADLNRFREKQRLKRYQHLPPEIARLYDEESIQGLYAMAQQVVIPRKKPQEEVVKVEAEDEEESSETWTKKPKIRFK